MCVFRATKNERKKAHTKNTTIEWEKEMNEQKKEKKIRMSNQKL